MNLKNMYVWSELPNIHNQKVDKMKRKTRLKLLDNESRKLLTMISSTIFLHVGQISALYQHVVNEMPIKRTNLMFIQTILTEISLVFDQSSSRYKNE